MQGPQTIETARAVIKAIEAVNAPNQQLLQVDSRPIGKWDRGLRDRNLESTTSGAEKRTSLSIL